MTLIVVVNRCRKSFSPRVHAGRVGVELRVSHLAHKQSTRDNPRALSDDKNESIARYQFAASDSMWMTFSKDLSAKVTGKTMVTVIVYLNDAWATPQKQTVAIDDVSVQ